MTADEYDTGEESSPTNRTRSGNAVVVGGDEGDRVALAGASSGDFDADRIRGADDERFTARVFRDGVRPAFADRRVRTFGTVNEMPSLLLRGDAS